MTKNKSKIYISSYLFELYTAYINRERKKDYHVGASLQDPTTKAKPPINEANFLSLLLQSESRDDL